MFQELELPTNVPQTNDILLVSGWGGLTSTQPYSSVLKSVNLSVITNEYCASLLGKRHLALPYTAFCAGEKTVFCS